ncbi:MAG: hypothetical protein RL095_747 [Verrucomicrobiota bacterium]
MAAEPASLARDEAQDWCAELVKVMARLRSPGGCAWDLEQTHSTLKQYLAEECAEVCDAIDLADDPNLCEELGDVLMNVVFHARIAEERRSFTFQDVARSITEKMIRRHPHVFGEAACHSASDVEAQWEVIKAAEKADKGPKSLLDGVPSSLSALRKAQKLQRKAAKAGFDWPDAAGPLAKVREETEELAAVLGQQELAAAELGDLLFSVVNLARKLGLEADDCLAAANSKFERRFRFVESSAATAGQKMPELGLEALDRYWDEAKRRGL